MTSLKGQPKIYRSEGARKDETDGTWWRSGLTTLLVGAFAAALAYSVGVFLKNLLE
jgi:hypothetical protein